MLCCAVLCCAVLCCAVLCCAVLCCAVLCCAVLCCAVLCCAVLCCVVLCCAVLCCALLCFAVFCCVMLYLFSVWQLLYIPNNTSSCFQTVFGTGSAWANCLSLFAFLRFWAGVATAGCLLARFVYCMELSLASNKTIVGYVNSTFISVGFTILSLFAYLIRDWRYLLTTLSIINAPLLLCWK